MSDDDETVIVMTNRRVYHTDETCHWITDRAREWDLDEALKAGRYECGHCHGEHLATKLSKADPDEVAPTEFDRERGDSDQLWTSPDCCTLYHNLYGVGVLCTT